MKKVLINITDEQYKELENKRRKNPRYHFSEAVRRWFDEIIKY